MLRDQNSQYEGKRTYNLIKCKVFYDSEYIVEDIEVGTKPFLENGLMVEKECVGALIIKHKGYKVNVGSGLSNQQRID
jgi:ATP-dependent DNA ligase